MRQGTLELRVNRFAIPAVILSAVMLLSGAAQAMDIVQFDQMTSQGRQAFLNFLPQAAETVLNQEGRSADAAKVHHLFNDISPGSNLPLGEAELEMNLANARVHDAEKHAQNPDAPRVQVEVALVGTLSKNGVQIAPDFAKAFMQLTGTIQH
jgi:hypothetical protein